MCAVSSDQEKRQISSPPHSESFFSAGEQEVGFPNLDRFAYLRNLGLPVPSYRERSRATDGRQRLR
jgi:hypothetical protein